MELTEEQARHIKHWRVDDECTWGRIAELTWEYFPELRKKMGRVGSFIGSQLCLHAMMYYNETVEDGWN